MKLEERALAARRRQRNLMTAIGVLALVLLFVASFKSYGDLRQGRAREAQLRGEIESSLVRIVTLQERVQRLRNDPAMLEQLAREELLMARPGEVVILLGDAKVTDAVIREVDG